MSQVLTRMVEPQDFCPTEDIVSRAALIVELEAFIKDQFDGNKAEAARHFQIADYHMHHILAGRKGINNRILGELGYERTKAFKKVPV